MKTFFIYLLLLLVQSIPLLSQIETKSVVVPNKKIDTNFVFPSSMPLISNQLEQARNFKFWGLNIIFSNNGYGLGFFFEQFFLNNLSAFVNLYISGARNTDEFEYYDPWTGETFIPNKVNRLYLLPLTFGINYFIFDKKLYKDFSPYVSLGIGPAFIIALPYEREFFSSISYGKFYPRFSSFIGIGTNILTQGNSYFGVSARYYYIPFGGSGLESIRGLPIKNFGGFFLGLNFGINF